MLHQTNTVSKIRMAFGIITFILYSLANFSSDLWFIKSIANIIGQQVNHFAKEVSFEENSSIIMTFNNIHTLLRSNF